MLQKLRDKTSGWIAGTIVIILIIPFAFFGVTDYFSAPSETWVAKVGDVEISQQEYQQRFEDYRNQMRQMLGERYDGRMLEQPETRRALLDRLVDEELLRQAAAAQGAIVSPTALQREIAAIPAFQMGGQFSPDQYRLLLSSQNMTPREFERRILRDLEVRTVPQQIEGSAFATAADVDRFLALRDQRRDIRFLTLEAPELGSEPLSEEDVVAFHERNRARFLSDEKVEIEYIELAASALEVPTVADEDTLRQRYEEASNRFVEPEQRLASHILIKTEADADADAQRVAQSKAQSLIEQARAEGADFAALARENSEDLGSRSGGGDLGWLERGLTDPSFETALFALESGAISEPVKSAEGWHVIQLRDIRAEKRKQFADVRADLEREFLETERERRFSDLSGQMVDALYKDPTTLESAAKQVGVEIRRAGPFSRLGGADPISSQPKVLEAAFSPSVLAERNSSDAIELDDGRIVALRVIDHQPAELIPLADIREQVEQELRQEQRATAASERANALFERLQAGETLATLAEELGVELQEGKELGRNAVTVDATLVTAAFELQPPAADQPVLTKVELGGERHALLQLLAVQPGDSSSTPADQREALRGQLASTNGSTEAQAYIAELRKQFEVRMAPERM